MHNKGTRESTRSSSQKLASNTSESPVKKTSQHSKRHRKSSTSSNDSSDREKVSKAAHSNVSKSDSPEVDKNSELHESIKSPKSNDNPRRTTRQSRKKLVSQAEEDTRSSTRKLRYQSRSHERTRDDKNEDKDDKTSKGKSKSKHRSKNEKQPQIQGVHAKSESEISDNVQVTSQSPQANIDIPVDNDIERDENQSTVPLQDNSDITTSVGDSNTKQNSNSDSNDCQEYQQPSDSKSDGIVTFEDESDKNNTSMEWQHVEQEIILEALPDQGECEVYQYEQEVLQEENNITECSLNSPSELLAHVVSRSKSSSPEAGTSRQISDNDNATSDAIGVADGSANVGDIPPQSDEDSRSMDVIISHEGSNTPPRDNKYNLSQSYNSEVRNIENINDEIQDMKNKVVEMFQTPPKPERKHKWGNSFVGLELIKPSMKNITIDTIKEICPNVAFLEENEIRLVAEHREKRVDRRISVEYKSDEDIRRYDTQSSHEDINSETDNSNIIALNRKISIVEDTASKMRPPPSPARNPVSPILYITNLVRPFTLKQLKELLERTGKIKDNGFWTDRIKSKCFVHYHNLEDAEVTRNALHGVNWPIGNGKQLMIEYSTPEEFEKARNPAPTPAALEKPQKIEKENIDIDKQVLVKRTRHEEPEKVLSERDSHRNEGYTHQWNAPREEMVNRRSHSRRHSGAHEARRDSRDRNDRRRGRRTATPPDYRSKKQRIKEEEPQKLMDDLFHKTKAVPSVYWLPLTPEEIATKQQERLLRMAEHKRRMEESAARNRGDHGRGAPFRRRYD